MYELMMSYNINNNNNKRNNYNGIEDDGGHWGGRGGDMRLF